MKHTYMIRRAFGIITIALAFVLPGNAFGKDTYSYTWNDQEDIRIFVSCVEDLGNGRFLAHFGYENPNETTVEVYYTRSVIFFNHLTEKEYVINSFEPGIHERVFSHEFDSDDFVKWMVRLSFWNFKFAVANSQSALCEGDLDIIPGYFPPVGGKEYSSKIGAELTSLYNGYSIDPASLEDAPEDIFRLDGTKVLIEVVAYDGQYNAMIDELNVPGFELLTADPDLYRATGWVEIGDLLLLNDMDPLNYARPVYPGVGNYIVPATGLVNSQGDFAMHSDFARLGYEIDGTGVKIGVLSNSYDTKGGAALNVENGDLPGSENPNDYFTEVDVLLDIAPTHGALSDEGRAMLQIIHDIAPGAELAFRTGYLGEQDMADGIRELAVAGCNVIVDDLSYITEPFFQDGVISQAIDEVVEDNEITFFSSAGNFGRASYMSVFDPEPAPSTITGTAHDFDGLGDIFQSVMLGEGNYTLVLQWDDGSDNTMNTTQTDLDLFLSDDVGSALLGFNRENVGGFPIEVVPFSVVGESVQANVVIARASGPDVPVIFKYILFRGGSQFQILEHGVDGSSTIVGHPNAAGAIAVGAVRFDKNPIYNPAEYPEPVIMSFSSIGGTPVGGTPLSGDVRPKPDFTAPNGINTTIDLGNGDWDTSDPGEYPTDIDPDTDFPNFFGTSAASPHAAGVAALIMHAKSKFDSEFTVTPEYIRDLMKSTTIEKEAGGVDDYISGSGFIQAHKALMTFANPSPYVENLILASEGGVPGVEITPFSFTISGDFFTESSQVYFRGEPLDAGVEVVDESTITVGHGGFIGNPEIQVFNLIISESGEDGGFSEGIYFSDPVKLTVVITASSEYKKYGEVLPGNTADVVVETVDDRTLTLEEAVLEGIMLQEEADRLSGLAYSVNADETSDAGQYIVVPSIFPVLDMENPVTEIDNAISEKYILEFVNGLLTIEKLALKITPMDVDMVYGESLLDDLEFLYEVDDSELDIPNLGLILSDAEQEHTSVLTNEISLARGIALVNGIPMIRGIALVNGVPLIRGIALVNGVEVKVEVVGEGEEEETTVYVAGEPVTSGSTLIRGIALVNDLPFVSMTEIVRGVALVNGDEVTFEDGYMTALNGNETLVNGSVHAVRGIALVNEPGVRGIALVNEHTVEVDINGVTTIDNVPVPTEGIVEINGIPVVRGIALVNSSHISRGIALVNEEVGVQIENGIPTARGIALVNENPTLRGIALVNGIPLIRGIALVNNLEVHTDDGIVTRVFENGIEINGFTVRGIALVNDVALINGSELISRGIALVNGIALTDEDGDGDENDLISLENMNFLASGTALTNGNIPNIRGIALVNGLEGIDEQELNLAAGTTLNGGTIVYESTSTSRGIALVNGLAYVRGIALVNDAPFVNDHVLVNGSSINEESNSGTILVFDGTDIGPQAENVIFHPISYITGTTAGQHWIIPGTYISNNFDISYGLGTLTIEPAELEITVTADQNKIYGQDDPTLTIDSYRLDGVLTDLVPDGTAEDIVLHGTDALSGELSRVGEGTPEGEDVGTYAILSNLTAGDNYAITYHGASFTITQAALEITAAAQAKTYGQSDPPLTLLSYSLDGMPGTEFDGSIEDVDLYGEDALSGTLSRVGEGTPEGEDVGTYAILSNLTAGDNYAITYHGASFTITQAALEITAAAQAKTYGQSDPPLTLLSYSLDGMPGTEFDGSIEDVDLYGEDALSGTLSRVGEGTPEGEDVGTYAILSTLTAGDNYAITYIGASLTITQAALEITAAAQAKTYGQSDPLLTLLSYSLDGLPGTEFDGSIEDVDLYGADALSGELSRVGAGTPAGENVGTYAILSSLTAGDNYTITYHGASLTINQAALEITAADQAKTYGQSDPPLTLLSYSLDGLPGTDFDGSIEDVDLYREDALSGSLSRVGEGTPAGEDVGTYAILSTLTAGDNYTITYHGASLTINQAALEITAADQAKTYGQSDPPLTLQSYSLDGVPGTDFDGSIEDVDLYWTDALSGTLSRVGEGTPAGENVGTYAILSSLTAGDNYTITYHGASLTINQAALEITAADQAKTYGQSDPPLTLQSYSLDGVPGTDFDGSIEDVDLYWTDALSGTLSRVGEGTPEGEDVGTYAILSTLTAGDNYAITYHGASFTITQADLSVTADNLSKTYGDIDPPLTYSISEGTLFFSDNFSGLLSRASGEDAGSYAITQGTLTPGPNYNFSVTPGSFTIEAAILTVTADINGKDYGEDDPPLTYTITEGSLVLGDQITGSLIRVSGEETGSYPIEQGTLDISNGHMGNYNFTFYPGTFYINPYGPSTRAIKPELNCIRELPPGSGYFEANFEYSNGNSDHVFIPVGPDNSLTGDGIFWEDSDDQPILFEPGGGTFKVFFDGTEISWIVNSIGQDHKVSNAANANSSSTKCNKNDLKSASVSADIQENELDPDLLVAYPIPVVDKLHITMKDIENYKMIMLYDFAGRSIPIKSIVKRADNLEIDMVQLASGPYFIRIVMEDTARVVQIIKK